MLFCLNRTKKDTINGIEVLLLALLLLILSLLDFLNDLGSSVDLGFLLSSSLLLCLIS